MAEEKTKFTEEQESAINSTGNVIVSAGAGSGKTTVLTERVKRNILGLNGPKVNLDELLILTFTNDAASSMKDKIKEALSKEESLKHLVPFVDGCHIETFDAYTQFIVKKYGYKFGYDKNIKVMSDAVLEVKVCNTLENIFKDLYLEKNPTFEELIYNYCTKNDKKLTDFVLEVYRNILSKIDNKVAYLLDYKDKYLNEIYFRKFPYLVDEVIEKNIDEIQESLRNLKNPTLQGYLIDEFSFLYEIKNLKDLQSSEHKFPDPTAVAKELKKYDEDKFGSLLIAKNVIALYKEVISFMNFDVETFINIDVNNEIKFLTFIIDNILIPLINKVDEFKRNTNSFTFGDIASIALSFLEKDEDIRNELKNQYKLIMIDEYQDTSYIQEDLINLISNNNVFAVGDIKQSIYRFRGAVPALFKSKYNSYKDPKNKNGEAIDMNRNFRSRHEILDTVNDMFSTLMFDDFGGANYKESHVIIPANKDYDDYGTDPNIKHGIYLLPNVNRFLVEPEKDPKKATKLELNKEDKIKAEATAIALNILERLNKGYKVYDRKTKSLKKASFKDFSILTYKTKTFPIYEEVFKKFNIPLNTIYDESLTEDNSITILSNIFLLISLMNEESSKEVNEKIKHIFLSLTRSFLFNYDESKIYELFSKDLYKEDPLFIKFLSLSKENRYSSLKVTFLNVIKEFNYIDKFSTLKGVINSIDKNNILYDNIVMMDDLGYTLKDLSVYFEMLNKFNIKMDQTVYSEASDAVIMRTIHKSKGLEYPVVYLPSLDDFSEPKVKTNGQYFVFDDARFFLPLFSDLKKECNLFGLTLAHDENLVKEDNEERLRLLYVALTRAKEDLIFVTNDGLIPTKEEELNEIIESLKVDYKANHNDVKEEDIILEANKILENNIKERNGTTFTDFLLNSYLPLDIDGYTPTFMKDPISYISKLYEGENVNLDEKIYKLYKIYERDNVNLTHTDLKDYIDHYSYIPKAKKKKEEDKEEKLISEEIIKFNSYYYNKFTYEEVGINKYKINIYDYFYNPNIKNSKGSLSFYLDNEADFNKVKALILNKDLKTLFKRYINDTKYMYYDFSEYEDSKINKEIIDLNFNKEEVTKFNKASKARDEDVDDSSLIYGTHIHALLENLDFLSPDYSFILDDKEKEYIKETLALLNESFDLNELDIYKEYQFKDEKNNISGAIDLLLVSKDECYIIDYKLKNIDDISYNKQLKAYKDYIEVAFKKKTRCYLLSVIDHELKEINK